MYENPDDMALIQLVLRGEQPSLWFSKNVMEAIAKTHIAPATKKYINCNLIRGIAAFFIIALTTMPGYALLSANWNSDSSGLLNGSGINNITFSDFFKGSYIDLIIAVNVVLALVLTDKIFHKRHHINAENYTIN